MGAIKLKIFKMNDNYSIQIETLNPHHQSVSFHVLTRLL